MTGKERVAVAMAGGVPDRVPFMCQLAIGHYLCHLDRSPAEFWLRNEVIIDSFVALAERYGMDGILINLPGRDPEAGADITREADGTERIRFPGFPGETICPPDDLPHHLPEVTTALADLEPDTLHYEDPHTLGGLKTPFHYDLYGDPGVFPSRLTVILEGVLARAEERFSVHAEVFSPFTQLMERLGYEAGLMALIDDPGKVHAVLERFAAGAAELGIRQATCGADAILISSAFAGGGFISRAMYETFVLPHERQVVEAIRAGCDAPPIYTHTCGAIGDRLELMAATGIDGLDTLDPPPIGNTDLADAKARVGDRLFLKGNVDSVNLLLHGTPQAVYDDARRRIDAAGPGGYILSSACSVAPAVPEANLLAMRRAVGA